MVIMTMSSRFVGRKMSEHRRSSSSIVRIFLSIVLAQLCSSTSGSAAVSDNKPASSSANQSLHVWLLAKYVALLLLLFIIFVVFGLMIAFVLRRRVGQYQTANLNGSKKAGPTYEDAAETPPSTFPHEPEATTAVSNTTNDDSLSSVQEIHVPELDLKSVSSTRTFEIVNGASGPKSNSDQSQSDSFKLQERIAARSTPNESQQSTSSNSKMRSSYPLDSKSEERSVDSSLCTNIWNEDSLLNTSSLSSSNGSLPTSDQPIRPSRTSTPNQPTKPPMNPSPEPHL
jgi:hypothetical protein